MNHIGYESAIGWYKLKLEEGDKANSWASSPEDTWALMDLTKDEIKAEVVSKKGGSETGFGWNLDDKSFNLYAINNRTRYTAFKCDKDGIEVTGRGKIGNWELNGDWLNTNNDGKTVHGGYSGVSIHRPTVFDGSHRTDDIVMICREGSGGSNYKNPFVLYSDGYLVCNKLHATGAEISGDITAEAGKIGSLIIDEDGNLGCESRVENYEDIQRDTYYDKDFSYEVFQIGSDYEENRNYVVTIGPNPIGYKDEYKNTEEAYVRIYYQGELKKNQKVKPTKKGSNWVFPTIELEFFQESSQPGKSDFEVEIRVEYTI